MKSCSFSYPLKDNVICNVNRALSVLKREMLIECSKNKMMVL